MGGEVGAMRGGKLWRNKGSEVEEQGGNYRGEVDDVRESREMMRNDSEQKRGGEGWGREIGKAELLAGEARRGGVEDVKEQDK